MDLPAHVAESRPEIALAVGDAPVTRGYPVSTLAALPQLAEQAEWSVQ